MGKGQMFLIIAIVAVIALALIKTSLSTYQILEKKRYLEAGLERLEFQNAREELLRTIEYSVYQKENITKSVEDFIKFARSYFKTKTIDLNGLAAELILPNVTAETNTSLNVTILNLLGIEIQNLNLTFSYDNSTRNFVAIRDGETVETSFIFNTSSNVNYSLSVYYLTSYENRTENITVPVEIGKSKFVGLFDLRLKSDRAEQRDIFTETYVLT
ncbi:MAG: hypothetical protein QMD12_00665 [Candidatus Aenigmarchaeota archaeon]|nr:hypothetical protein [Candidatus Aenigmarchaeota archaeon]